MKSKVNRMLSKQTKASSKVLNPTHQSLFSSQSTNQLLKKQRAAVIRHEVESRIHHDIKSHRLREYMGIGKNVDQENPKRRHKFTLHDVQSGGVGYAEYIGLPEDE